MNVKTMVYRRIWLEAATCCGLIFAPLCAAQEKPARAIGPTGGDGPLIPRPTVKVTRGPIVASTKLQGAIESDKPTEIRVRLKTWGGPLVVEQAVEHGAPVRQGDRLLAFESEKLGQLVRASLQERELARLAIRQAELELPLLKRQVPVDLLAAEREKTQTADDLERFLEVERPRQVAEAQFSLKSAAFGVESARDELTQLQKMYSDKDLTEETEQMILKRYKFGLERAEHFFRNTKLQTEQKLEIDLPRREKALQLSAAKAGLAWERSREQLPLQIRQKELALEKLRFEEGRATEKLEELDADLRTLNVMAPTQGLVYYGRCSRGQWSGPQPAAYLPGGTLPANEVVMTIINSDRLLLNAQVEEKDLSELKVGQVARITPTMFPNKRIAARVDRLNVAPLGGKFGVVLALVDESLGQIVPGMTGSAEVITQQKADTLTIPRSAIFDDAEAEIRYVFLAREPPTRRAVTVGILGADKAEIIDGLAEGDEILSSKP